MERQLKVLHDLRVRASRLNRVAGRWLRPPRAHGGLRKLSPEKLGKALTETDKQINSLMLTFLGAIAFCVLSLLTPDSALLGASDKVNVPLAGPVSFVGFIIVGPAVLVLLRVYLEIYVEHGDRLAHLVARRAEQRDPTLLSSRILTVTINSHTHLAKVESVFLAVIGPTRGAGAVAGMATNSLTCGELQNRVIRTATNSAKLPSPMAWLVLVQ